MPRGGLEMLVWVAGLQLQKEVCFLICVVRREKSSLSASDELLWGAGAQTTPRIHRINPYAGPPTYTEYQLQAAIRLPFDCNVYSVPSYKC